MLLPSQTPPLSGTLTPNRNGGIMKRSGSITPVTLEDGTRVPIPGARRVKFNQLPESDEERRVSSTKRYKDADRKTTSTPTFATLEQVSEALPPRRARRTRLVLDEVESSEEEEVEELEKRVRKVPVKATQDEQTSFS